MRNRRSELSAPRSNSDENTPTSLARTEELLNTTGAAVSHLRCGMFFTNLLLQLENVYAGALSVAVPVDQPLPWVAPRDLAEAAVLRLVSKSWSGLNVQAVYGPRDLTWQQVASVVTAATGHPITVQQIPDSTMREGLVAAGLAEVAVEAVMGMSNRAPRRLRPRARS